ncbi:MAG TPA: glycosyltransferase [Anaerolineae bacterium]|jgi:cellulose synthase/poly-beta-1,6-N-acetylglucosamine synthase-like glycosyltransferase|nr:glycosyltransferase [Anaerolineae bacterium]
MIVTWLSGIYVMAASGIAVFGMLGLVTLWYYWRHRQDSFPCPEVDREELPKVTIQLPVFNERFVIGRLVDAATQLDYPADKLQIQVIDDSTDDTTEIAGKLVNRYQAQGMNIQLLHRDNRQGFKAGALQEGLHRASGDYVAIFDADFQPDPDYLRRTIPHFLSDPQLGMVQVRWGHLNSGDSQLTGAQSIALDKHFAMEQTVRHRANLYPKFNGSAGVWRRTCLEEAGGWQDDTVCEDLCLSTRAILKGWRFRFLNEVEAPAELPSTISAYKNQQARWAKGSTQCLVKFGPAILTDTRQRLVARLYALLSMAAYMTHLLLLILLLVQVPLIYLGFRPPAGLLLFAVAGIGQPLLFVLGQRELYSDWQHRLRFFPALLLVAVGLAPANTRAIAQAVFGRHHTFVRTPKGAPTTVLLASINPAGARSAAVHYRLPVDWIVLVELLLSAYALAGLILCLRTGNVGPIFFMLICTLGFAYVAQASIREQLQRY